MGGRIVFHKRISVAEWEAGKVWHKYYFANLLLMYATELMMMVDGGGPTMYGHLASYFLGGFQVFLAWDDSWEEEHEHATVRWLSKLGTKNITMKAYITF